MKFCSDALAYKSWSPDVRKHVWYRQQHHQQHHYDLELLLLFIIIIYFSVEMKIAM